MGKYLTNAGNIGIFCHYDDEYSFLTDLRKEITQESDNFNQKYFRLHQAITIATQGNIPATTYTYLYIRKPDPYRHHVGDVDFFLQEDEYKKVKQQLLNDNKIQ
jgi:hypothetical protein